MKLEEIQAMLLDAKQQTKVACAANKVPFKGTTTLTETDQLASWILYVSSNEELFRPYLAELNNEIAKAFTVLDKLPDAPSSYTEIIQLKFPLPPSKPLEQGPRLINALERALLTQEKKHGVNLNRMVDDIPLFIGPVPPEAAAQVLNNNELWNYDNYDLSGFIYGTYPHRIAHYVFTRYKEDNPKILNDFLAPEAQTGLFKHLVEPQTTFSFLFSDPVNNICYERSYWELTLDNHTAMFAGCFIKEKPNITGPTILTEYLLTAKAFQEWSYLAHCIYHTMCVPLFYMSSKMGKAVKNIFDLYQEGCPSGKPSQREWAIAYMEHIKTLLVGTSARTFAQFQRPLSGISHAISTRQEMRALLEKYNMAKELIPDYEKLLRNAAINGYAQDVQFIIKHVKSLDINKPDDGSHKKTALHWAVFKGREECIKVLTVAGADWNIKDASGNTPKYYQLPQEDIKLNGLPQFSRHG